MSSPKNSPAPDAELAGREVLVCVCGGIAAYKVGNVVSGLAQRGAGVTVAMTRAAMRLAAPMTFQALSGRRVLTSLWEPADETDAQHIRITDAANLVLVAPATANMIGKVACGIADDLVSTLVMSAAGPVVFAPTMNERMWTNPIVAGNVKKLTELGYTFIGPGAGWLACRHVGVGRMSEPDEILATVSRMLLVTHPDRPTCPERRREG